MTSLIASPTLTAIATVTTAALANSNFAAANPGNFTSWVNSTLPNLSRTTGLSRGNFNGSGTGALTNRTKGFIRGGLTNSSGAGASTAGTLYFAGANTNASSGTGSLTSGTTGLVGGNSNGSSDTGAGLVLVASGTAGGRGGSLGEIAGGGAAGVAGAAGIAAAAALAGSGAGSAAEVAAGNEGSGNENTEDNDDNDDDDNDNDNTTRSQNPGPSGTQTPSLSNFLSQSQSLSNGTLPFTSGTMMPTAMETQNWTIPSPSIDVNGIASVAALLYRALSSSGGAGDGGVSTSLGITEAAGLFATGTTAATSSSVPQGGVNVEDYCHPALGGSSGSVCVYVPPAGRTD